MLRILLHLIMKLILASGSERRRELLSWIGIPFEIVISDFDEGSVHERNPEKLVERLALEKAKAVAERIQKSEVPEKLRHGAGRSQKREQSLVIGADTVVRVDHETIGKPKDEKDAARILRKLSGTTHVVFTGVAVVNAHSGESFVEAEKTRVTFRKLKEAEIRAYVASGEPLDKGGGYAIQMGAKGFVTSVEGSFTNVVGLPLLTLTGLLEKHGYQVRNTVSEILFEKTGYRS